MSGGLGFGVPGFTSSRTTVETDISWGGQVFSAQLRYKSVQLDSTTIDSGNTPNTVLRPGLVLGVITSSGNFVHYSPTATDGSQFAVGVLGIEMNMLDPVTAAANARVCPVIVGGPVKGARLIGFDQVARAQMVNRFQFDDDFFSGYSFPHKQEVSKSANTTVTAADNGTLFIATGAVTFTLPTRAAGLRFQFLNIADNSVAVSSALGSDIIVDGNAAANTITFSTSSHKIGGWVELVCNAAGTLWYAKILSGPGPTATIS